MRVFLIIVTFLLGFFILTSGIKIIEKRMETMAEIYRELSKK